MEQKNNKMLLLKILLYSIFSFLIILPLFSLQVKKPKIGYISANYTLISLYNEGLTNKNITGLQEIAMINRTERNFSKEYIPKINKEVQKENRNIFLAVNEKNNFITNKQISNMVSINNIFPKNSSSEVSQTKNLNENQNTIVVKTIKSEILNIMPKNIQTLYSEKASIKNNIEKNYGETSPDYKYVSYVNGKPEGIALLKF